MKPTVVVAVALALSACAPVANTSQTILIRPLFTESTIRGAGFPIMVRGAQNVGLEPVTLAQTLRYPASLLPGSSFRAVQDSPDLGSHARLDIAPSGANAIATLTFLHGERRIGVGTFTLPQAAFADPAAVGSASSSLIFSMLIQARNDRKDSDDGLWMLR